MEQKQNNLKKVKHVSKIITERIKIDKELNNILQELIKKDEKLENYEIWVNEKSDIFIQPIFIIEKYIKDLEKEGFKKNTAYVIIKKN